MLLFKEIGDAFNAPISTKETLELVAKSMVKQLKLKACHFRLLSRDQKILEDVASFGLSRKFLDKGPVDAEKSVAEALQGQLVMIDDCSNDTRIQYPKEFAEEGIVSLLTVPLIAREQVIGVMRLFTGEPREYQDEELQVINAAATFCTTAIVHSMFHDILTDVNEAINISLDLDEVLTSIVQVVSDSLRIKGTTIRLLDRAKQLELRASFGLSDEFLEKVVAEVGPGIKETLQGECVSILDARTDPRILWQDEVRQEGISSILYVPMTIRGQSIGVLGLYTHNKYAFSADEVGLMKAIADQSSLAIRNAQMFAGVKGRYDSLVNDFQMWFEHYHTYATPG
jgi:signal transduction protein with GAF and PtsI domain